MGRQIVGGTCSPVGFSVSNERLRRKGWNGKEKKSMVGSAEYALSLMTGLLLNYYYCNGKNCKDSWPRTSSVPLSKGMVIREAQLRLELQILLRYLTNF